MPSGEHLGSDGSVATAADAFRASIDAETPSRSKQAPAEQKERPKQDISDVFPARRMDRTEQEADDTPEPVKKARAERQPKDIPDEPDDEAATEPNYDEDDEEYDEEQQPQDEDVTEPDDEDEDEAARSKDDIDPNTVVRITVDGEPMEVSLAEMARGYTRTATFHKRMGELSQGVQALHHAKLELDGYYNAHVERANALESYIQAFMPTEPDWNALRAANPAEAANLRFEWNDFQQKLQGLQHSRAQAMQAMQAQHQERLTQFANANRAQLAQRHPEWKQEKVWRRDNESMRRSAKAAGYTDEEVSQLYDARAVEILLKAARYDRMMASKPKPVRQVPKNGNGVTRPRPNISRSFDRAEKRLSRTGSVGDAASVFERMLDRER
jgi:hypothetical protein